MHPHGAEVSELTEKSLGILICGRGSQAGREPGRKVKFPHQESVTPLLLDAKSKCKIMQNLMYCLESSCPLLVSHRATFYLHQWQVKYFPNIPLTRSPHLPCLLRLEVPVFSGPNPGHHPYLLPTVSFL